MTLKEKKKKPTKRRKKTSAIILFIWAVECIYPDRFRLPTDSIVLRYMIIL